MFLPTPALEELLLLRVLVELELEVFVAGIVGLDDGAKSLEDELGRLQVAKVRHCVETRRHKVAHLLLAATCQQLKQLQQARLSVFD